MRGTAYLFAFLGGCGVMVVEILGTRVLTPHFGAALFVWTAQIAVTLACLAVGYWAGGNLTQRQADLSSVAALRRYVGAFSGCTGLWLLGLPLLAKHVLPLLHGIDLRLGALAASTLLFALPLCLLACIPPICVSALATGGMPPGSAAGRLYAVSTLGSFGTTICLGFWLIPGHSINGTVQITGTILLASGVAVLLPAVISARRRLIVLAAVFAGGVVTVHLTPHPLDGPGVVYRTDSPHAEIGVLDTGGYRILLLDRLGHTVLRKKDLMPADSHFYYLNALTVMRPRGRHALLLGVAGGAALRAVESHDLRWDAVELDPEVLRVAHTFFDLPEMPGIRYFTADARAFLRTADCDYDFVVIDTYASDAMPRHLCSVEAFDSVRNVMRPDGILAINQLGSLTGPNSRAWAATWYTLSTVFRHIRAFSFHPGSFSGELGVVTIFASNAPLEMSGEEVADAGLSETALRHLRRMPACEISEPSLPGVLLTDDRNRIEGWGLDAAAEVRAAWDRLVGL